MGGQDHSLGRGRRRRAQISRLAHVFRIAITNARIVGFDDQTVSFRYKHRASSRWRTCRIDGLEFMRRYLQHVLPKGLHKVRYFGLWHPSRRLTATKVRLLLSLERGHSPPAEPARDVAEPDDDTQAAAKPRICPRCRRGHLVFVRELLPKWAQAP